MKVCLGKALHKPCFTGMMPILASVCSFEALAVMEIQNTRLFTNWTIWNSHGR